MPPIDLCDQDRAILVELLREAVNRERMFPLPPLVIARAKAILDQLDSSPQSKK